MQVPVPAEWVDTIFLRVRALLDTVQARNVRMQQARNVRMRQARNVRMQQARNVSMQSGKCQADDLISDKAAEGFLQTVLYNGVCL